MEERDSKGRYVKGQTPKGAIPISKGMAKDYQARSVKARKRNRTLAEVVRAELEKPAPGSELTKMEYLAAKAIMLHGSGSVTFKDLQDLQKVLGEDVKKFEFGTEPLHLTLADDAALEGLRKALETGARPRMPSEEE